MGRGSEDSEPLTRNFHFQLACEKVTRFIIIIIIILNLIEKVNSFFHLYIFGLEIEKKKEATAQNLVLILDRWCGRDPGIW